ncbi:unnamed protein product [Peniophora sp. CBMAI 1063]|nr:unnamed protein product [Peniophora sp. CBMAI 1063]
MPVPTAPPAPPFTLETVLDLLDTPGKLKVNLLYPDVRRLELRQRFEESAGARPGKLPPPTLGLCSVWSSVSNVQLPQKAHWDLESSDPKHIAKALLVLGLLYIERLGETMRTLASHADASVDFAWDMAELIAESLHITSNEAVAEEARHSVCASELAKLQQFWAPHDGQASWASFGVRGWSRLMFFGGLFDSGVATVEEYVQLLEHLIEGGTPCTFRLKAVKVAAEFGDKRVRSLCSADLGLVVDTLETINRRGNRTWTLGGHLGAAKMLKEIRYRIDGWRAAAHRNDE